MTKNIEDLDKNTRRVLQSINNDLEAAQHGLEIRGFWETRPIDNLTDDDQSYLRDEVIRLLQAGKDTLLEDI